MNLQCMSCGGPFGELDVVQCDGCERPSHREPCGTYELITQSYTGEVAAYFFCNSCLREDTDASII